MNKSNEKIGNLISQIRQERGLSQAEFARKLKTSQSAVNRIEKGKQNLSLETLARISDVLNKQLISVNPGSINLRIEGGHDLKGEITLKTSKNAAVGLLCASLLNEGVTKLTLSVCANLQSNVTVSAEPSTSAKKQSSTSSS